MYNSSFGYLEIYVLQIIQVPSGRTYLKQDVLRLVELMFVLETVRPSTEFKIGSKPTHLFIRCSCSINFP